jgi:aminoglycoside phosphotransferase (APT) family kinase protein
MGLILLRISKQPDDLAFTPATGARLHWDQLPSAIRHALEAKLGSTVIESVTQVGGFSPGVAARLRLADGRRVFVKAISRHPNPDSPAMHRREARIAAALPRSVPTPRFLWLYDDGDWVAMAFEDVDGWTPVTPWRPQELSRVLAALTQLVESLTPSPIAVETIAERLHEPLQGWRTLQSAARANSDDVGSLPGWARRNLERLAALESEWEAASAGETLLHFDLRADNIVLTTDRVLIVDWPHASLGAAWMELLQILPSIAMQGGPKPWEIFDSHPLGRHAPDRAVTAVLAAVAGYFVRQSRLPAPPGLPTLRAFQRDQGIPAMEWLRRRTGWP